MNGREEGGQRYILETCDQERFEARKGVFPWECLNIFATGCSIMAGLHAQGWLIYKYLLKFINWQINCKIKIGLYVNR